MLMIFDTIQGSAQRRLQSNQTSDLIDAEVKALIDNAYDRKKKIRETKRESLLMALVLFSCFRYEEIVE